MYLCILFMYLLSLSFHLLPLDTDNREKGFKEFGPAWLSSEVTVDLKQLKENDILLY